MFVCAALAVVALALLTMVALRVRETVPMSKGNRLAGAALLGIVGIVIGWSVFGDAVQIPPSGSNVLPTALFVLTQGGYFLVVGYLLSRRRGAERLILAALCAPWLLVTLVSSVGEGNIGTAVEGAFVLVIAILGSLAGGALAGRRAQGSPAPQVGPPSRPN
jgi:hypothetical protein